MKRILIIASLLMIGMLPIVAQTLKVNGTSVSADNELVITIASEGVSNNYIATGFCIELPNGFSASSVEAQKTDELQSDHVIRVGQVADNKIRVAVYSLSNKPLDISTTGGGSSSLRAFCNIKLKDPNKFGSYEGKLSGIEFATSSHSLVTANPTSFDITIPLTGDVDGDGEIDAIDFNIIGNHILGFGQSQFNEKAADINGDGEIDAIDFNMVANYILYGSYGGASASREFIVEDDKDPS